VYDTMRRLRASQSNGPNLRAVVDVDSMCAYTHLQLELAPEGWDPRPLPLQLDLDLDLDLDLAATLPTTLPAIGPAPDQRRGWSM
jgi:hypothetical protein